MPIPIVAETDHRLGDPEAPITLLIYSDFQCPYCAQFYESWKEIAVRHHDDVQLIFRHYPLLAIHDKADIAGAAAEIAGRSGKFWEMHDALFENQSEWTSLSRLDFVDWLTELAETLELDSEQFRQELETGEDLQVMIEAFQSGLDSGIPGTPFIFFNDTWYRLNPTSQNLEASIQLELLKELQYADPPSYALDPEAIYLAYIEVERGEIVVQLYPDIAPATVANFIFLSEEGWYDGLGFHRVEQNLLVETGDPTGTGLGGPGYLLLDELSDTLSFDNPGMVAMSSEGPNTNGSRFFINLSPLPSLNGSRTIFGRVIEGIELLSALEERDPFADLFEPFEVTIRSIRIEIR